MRRLVKKLLNEIYLRSRGVEKKTELGRLRERVLDLWKKNEQNREAVTDQTVRLINMWAEIALIKEANESSNN